MFRLEDQEINGVKILQWDPEVRPERVMYYKIITTAATDEAAFEELRQKFEALPELDEKPTWGYWDVIVKKKTDVDFVGYSRHGDWDGRSETRIAFYLMGPAGKSEKRRDRKRK